MGTAILAQGLRLTQPTLGVLVLTAACARGPVELTAPGPFPHAGPSILSVATWNLDAGRGDLRDLVADLTSGRWTGVRTDDVLLLLQETAVADAPQLARFADARGWSMVLVPVPSRGPRALGNAIVSSRPLVNPRTIQLPRERQPRVAAVGSIDLDGHRLFVVSAHLENRVSWWRGGLFADSARARQANALLHALPDGPGILGGDLNTMLGPNEGAWRTLAQRFDDTPPAPDTPTFRDRLFLDHLFFDLPPGWQAATVVVPDRYGSDHHPVVGVISVR